MLVGVPGASSGRVADRYVHFGYPYVHYLLYERDPTVTFSKPKETMFEDSRRSLTSNGTVSLIPAPYGDFSSTYGGSMFASARFWSSPANWTYWRGNSVGLVFWKGLVVNAVCLIGASVIVAGLFELRRRRRAKLWQVTTVDLLVGLMAVGLVFGLWQRTRLQNQHDARVVGKIQGELPGALTDFGSRFRLFPNLFAHRLADYRLYDFDGFLEKRGLIRATEIFSPYGAFDSVTLRGRAELAGPRVAFSPELADALRQLKSLRRITLVGIDGRHLEILSDLNVGEIQSLVIYGLLGGESLSTLSDLPNLRVLELIEFDLGGGEFERPRLDSLEHLSVEPEFLNEDTIDWIGTLPRLRVLHLHTPFRVENLKEIRGQLPRIHVVEDLQMMGGGSFGG